MPTVPEVIQRLDAFLAEISSLMKQTKVGVPLLNQKVEQWSQRVHVTLSNWGRGDDANRFTGAFYTTEQGYPISTLQNKVAARLIVLNIKIFGKPNSHPSEQKIDPLQ